MIGFHAHEHHQTQQPRLMYINSGDVTSHHENTTHYTYTFKDAVHTRQGEGMLVSLFSASVPYSFYNIRAGVNNKFHFTVSGLSPTAKLYEIPPGNYTATSLATAIKTGMSAYIAVDIVFDSKTQTYTFSTATSNTITIKIYPDSPAIELGLTEDTVITSASPQTSVNAVDVNGSVHALYVRTDIPTLSVLESFSGGVSDILGKIGIDTNPGGIINHSNALHGGHVSLIHTNHIKSVSVRLTDERNRLLDLNGLHFQIGIQFKFVSLKGLVPPDPAPRSAKQPEAQPNVEPDKTTRNQHKNKKQRRKQALRKGKEKVKDALSKQAKAKQANTKTKKD